jgi:hypothetical protein
MLRKSTYRHALHAAILGVAVIQAGCVTTGKVRSIVETSNATIIASSLVSGATELDPSAARADDWKVEVDRIEQFIATHPDQPRTVNTLRVRQAIVLLSARQYNMARLALEQVEPDQLFSERDRAIYHLREHIVWWWRLGGSVSAAALTSDDRDRARAAVQALAAEADNLDVTSGTRRFLEQMRMRIALRWARTLSSSNTARPILEEATARFASQFEEPERTLIQRWHLRPEEPLPSARLSDLRWYDYVPSAFDETDTILAGLGEPTGAFTPAWIGCIQSRNCPMSP